jgi:flagellar FliL protein
MGLVLLIGGGAGGWYFMNQNAHPGGAAGKAKAEPAKPPVFVMLDPFTVNLQAEAGEQFLQVAFTLQVTDQAEVDLIKLYMPQVRSRLLLMLSSKKASEISTLEGKKKLSTDIAALVNQPFAPNGKPLGVSNVFFTSFVIQ